MSIIIFIAMIVCIVDTAIIFQQRNEKWWYALIPGYSKYMFGHLCNQKKAGVIVAVASILWYGLVIYIAIYEYQLYAQYYAGMYNDSIITLEVDERIMNTINSLRGAMVIISGIYVISWTYVMTKFSAMHGKSSKWMIGWVVAPVFLLSYFALSNKVSMYGDHYIMTRVPDKHGNYDVVEKSFTTKIKEKFSNDRRK